MARGADIREYMPRLKSNLDNPAGLATWYNEILLSHCPVPGPKHGKPMPLAIFEIGERH
jgi:hypothetical protein